MCPLGRAHWRRLANTIELMLTVGPRESTTQVVNRSVQPFLYSSRQSVVGYARACPCPLTWGSGLHLMYASLGPPESITETASQSIQPFLHSSRQSIVGHIGAYRSPSKLPIPMGNVDPLLTHGSMGLPESSTRRASRSVQPFLQGV